MEKQPNQSGHGGVWSQTTSRTREAWSSRPSLAQRVVMIATALVLVGLFAIVGTVALVVGIGVVAVMAIVVLIQRGLAKLRGDRAPRDTLRKNVRVMKRDGG